LKNRLKKLIKAAYIGSGTHVKLMNCRKGHTFQLVRIVGQNLY